MSERWTPTADGKRWNRLRTVEVDTTTMPEPEQRVTRMDPLHPAIPRMIKAMWNLAAQAGWDAWLQYSKVPRKRVDPVRWEQVAILAVCAQRPGQRVYVAWEYHPGEAKWKAESTFLAPPWREATQVEAKEMLNA